jgi:hypothetical protein
MVAAEVCAELLRISAKAISAGQGCARGTTPPWDRSGAQPERLWPPGLPALAQGLRDAAGGLQNPTKAGWQKGWTWGAPWPCTLMCTLTKKSDQLEAAVDQAIAACGRDAREAVKALVVANTFLETELEKLRAAVSPGYARGQLRDRMNWYD